MRIRLHATSFSQAKPPLEDSIRRPPVQEASVLPTPLVGHKNMRVYDDL